MRTQHGEIMLAVEPGYLLVWMPDDTLLGEVLRVRADDGGPRVPDLTDEVTLLLIRQLVEAHLGLRQALGISPGPRGLYRLLAQSRAPVDGTDNQR